MMRFYRFECHEGDDNDNSITEVIVESPDLECALDHLARHAMPMEAEVDYAEDGEYSNVTGFWYESTDDLEYDEEWGGIPRHCDYYFQAEYETFDDALKAIPYYHGISAHYTVEVE